MLTKINDSIFVVLLLERRLLVQEGDSSGNLLIKIIVFAENGLIDAVEVEVIRYGFIISRASVKFPFLREFAPI